MHAIDLILTLTGGVAAALGCGYITFRLGLSPIVGYLVAGFLVGPNTPGFVANKDLADQLAEIGVILLMFGVGLQFHLKELLAIRRVALPGAAATEALPMRDAFAVLSFVSVGLLFSPRYLIESPGLVAATLGVILLGKPLAALAIP